MKHILFLLIIGTISSCKNNKVPVLPNSSKSVSVVFDVTDDHLLKPTAGALMPLFGFSQTPHSAASFRIGAITNKKLNPVYTCSIANGSVTEQQNKTNDPLHRSKCIAAFYERTQQLISKILLDDSTVELSNTECAFVIGRELQYFASDTSLQKTLVVFGNLMEKSELYNAYQTLPSQNDLIALLAQSKYFPEKLNGITVFFVFQPKDRIEDKRYMRLVTAYQEMLEKRGAKVIVHANGDFIATQ